MTRTLHYLRLLTVMLAVATAGAPAFAKTDTRSFNTAHHQEYLAALHKVIDAKARLAHEMNRILLGHVSHYDFLQYEHIELLRFGRALAHPPAGIAESGRSEVVLQAANVLDAAEQIEWVIADFLRTYAQQRGALANIQDLSALLAGNAEPELQQQLLAFEEAALYFYGDRGTEARQTVLTLYADLPAAALDAKLAAQLALQVELLCAEAANPADQLLRLEESNVEQLAAALEGDYRNLTQGY